MRNSGGRICDDCQMRPATTLSTIELNGNVYEVALCDECFRKRNAANAPVYQAFMQQEQSCKNVGAILEEAGLTFDNVIKTTCFLADMADFAAFNAVYEKYFTSKPARSCVAVKQLPKNVLCEVEAIAVAE